MIAYLLGLLTLPALAGALRVGYWTLRALASRGFTFEVKLRRKVDEIDDYTLRHGVWWERSFGPIFVGGWYREKPHYGGSPEPIINRWVGVGSTHGPCFMAFRSRSLA